MKNCLLLKKKIKKIKYKTHCAHYWRQIHNINIWKHSLPYSLLNKLLKSSHHCIHISSKTFLNFIPKWFHQTDCIFSVLFTEMQQSYNMCLKPTSDELLCKSCISSKKYLWYISSVSVYSSNKNRCPELLLAWMFKCVFLFCCLWVSTLCWGGTAREMFFTKDSELPCHISLPWSKQICSIA